MRENGDREEPKLERGAQYPADNLEVGVQMLTRVREAVGFAQASRETIAEALGYSGISGASARKLAVLTHFDLIERVGGGAYRISELGRQILIPTDESEQRLAIAEAAKRPKLYASLLEKYAGGPLPTLLPNLLVREHRVSAAASDPAARTFRETMEFAGLLKHGILGDQIEPAKPSSIQNDGDSAQAITGTITTSGGRRDLSSSRHDQVPVPDPGNSQTYTIALDNSGRVATIQLPVPATERDMRKISAWSNYMLQVVQDDPNGQQ